MTIRFAASVLATVLICGGAAAEPLTVPFDFSHAEIGLDVTIKGHPAYVMLDTGVDPSAIDIRQANALGLAVDRGAGGEVSGEGDAREAKAFPATIEGLAIAGRSYRAFEALAVDMSGLSKAYGRRLDGVLGYSFLSDKIVLIDYVQHTVSFLDRPADATSAIRRCAKHWSTPLRNYADSTWPVIADFRIGTAHAPVTLDTGSSGSLSLAKAALALPAVQTALHEKGKETSMGARGNSTAKTYVLQVPVGFGPFTLPAGLIVPVQSIDGSLTTRVANVGNKLFAALKLKMLLDYKNRRMSFYGDCR